MGPTASGKTALAMALCDVLPCDIISVDSALIYNDMDIGTAKPTAEELSKYPHRLINLRDATKSYSAADFCHDALAEIAKIRANNRIPLLVGGTMMYFKFLRDGAAQLPTANEDIRQRLLAEAEQFGWPHMHAKLAQIDPVSAERLKPRDSQRIQRALEVYEVSGKTLTQFWAEQNEQPLPYDVIRCAVMPKERKTLHKRIAQRYQIMMKQGFVEEVKGLFARGDLHEDLPSVRCVGYRQVWQYLKGEIDYDEMVERGIIATRQLAKRQITWLRSWPDLNWLDTEDQNLLKSALKILP